MSSIKVSVELLTLLVGGSGAVLACLDAGLDTRRRDVLGRKKSSLMSPAWGATLDYEGVWGGMSSLLRCRAVFSLHSEEGETRG
jgi:hypothetical protein